jgi:hypothetical protein
MKQSGSRTRINLFEMSLFPKGQQVRGKFTLLVNWRYRKNFRETVADLTVAENKYFTAGYNYTFFSADDGSKSAKIGFDYTEGDNPTRNF